MLACARLGAVHSVVFGGFAAAELAVRIDDATAQGRSCRRRAGSSRPASSSTSRCSTGRSRSPTHEPRAVVVKQREQAPAEMVEDRDVDWDVADEGRQERSGSVRRGRAPPTRSTSSTRRARPGSRRASSATTVGTRWHWPGRCPTSTTSAPARSGGPPPTSAGSSATPTSSTRPLIVGATTILYEGKPVGTPDAGAFWRVIADHGVEGLFTAPTAIRAIKKEDPDGELIEQARPVVAAPPLPGRRAARPRDLPLGVRAARHTRDRPLVADRDGLADRRQPARARADADQAGLAERAGAGVRRAASSTSRATQVQAGTEGAICIRLPLPPGTLPTLWGTTNGTSRPT